VSSVTEGAGLPAREAAAAGRLVISTPVGDFPLLASRGLGIVAPIESHEYEKFVAKPIKYYKDNPPAFIERCRNIQNAARQLDWPNVIGDWVELIETAKAYPLKRGSR
jgi:glycosyltransferase involved in cell wall biosynthesis